MHLPHFELHPVLFVDFANTSLSRAFDWAYWKEAFVDSRPDKRSPLKDVHPDKLVADYTSVTFPLAHLCQKMPRNTANYPIIWTP